MEQIKVLSDDIGSLFDRINKVDTPVKESSLYEVLVDKDIIFSNKIFYTKGLLLSMDTSDSFPIKIHKDTGLMICYLSSTKLKESILEKLAERFQEEDKLYIKYTIHPRRIYANGLELAVKELQDRGIIAIYCRETLPYRNNIENTKKCILDVLKDIDK